MSNIPVQDPFLIKTIGCLISIIGIVLVFCGGLIGYVFQSHRKQNSDEHRELFTQAKDNGENIAKIEGRLKL